MNIQELEQENARLTALVAKMREALEYAGRDNFADEQNWMKFWNLRREVLSLTPADMGEWSAKVDGMAEEISKRMNENSTLRAKLAEVKQANTHLQNCLDARELLIYFFIR